MTSPSDHRTNDEQVYRCWYDDENGLRQCTDVPRHKGIAQFREGIFVDAEGQYAPGLAWAAWVPPSRIVVVRLANVTALDVSK